MNFFPWWRQLLMQYHLLPWAFDFSDGQITTAQHSTAHSPPHTPSLCMCLHLALWIASLLVVNGLGCEPPSSGAQGLCSTRPGAFGNMYCPAGGAAAFCIDSRVTHVARRNCKVMYAVLWSPSSFRFNTDGESKLEFAVVLCFCGLLGLSRHWSRVMKADCSQFIYAPYYCWCLLFLPSPPSPQFSFKYCVCTLLSSLAAKTIRYTQVNAGQMPKPTGARRSRVKGGKYYGPLYFVINRNYHFCDILWYLQQLALLS